jgi:hypothetical protein
VTDETAGRETLSTSLADPACTYRLPPKRTDRNRSHRHRFGSAARKTTARNGHCHSERMPTSNRRGRWTSRLEMSATADTTAGNERRRPPCLARRITVAGFPPMRCSERPDDAMGVLLRLPDLLRPGSDGARGIFGHATSSTVSDHSLDGTLELWPRAAARGRCHAAAGRRRTPPRSGRPRSSCRRRGSRT